LRKALGLGTVVVALTIDDRERILSALDDARTAAGPMSNPFGHRTKRLQSVQAAAADDEQIRISRRRDERTDGFVRRVLAPAVDDCVDRSAVDCLTAVGRRQATTQR
jgi:hypothetical protein